MTRSLSTLKNVILTASFALLPFVAVSASAQTAARVSIPFGFVANQHYVPAGSYRVLPSENSVTLIDADTQKAVAILLIRKEAGDVIESRGRLEFYVRGGRHTLVDVQFAGSSAHSKLLGQPKPERQIASDSQPSGSTVELALR
jgi:hypothetical protein